MAEQACPNCGNEVPSALGQHAENLVTGLVTCPHCGASVSLGGGPDAADDEPSAPVERAAAAPPGRPEGNESFSGNETFGGLVEELKDKPS